MRRIGKKKKKKGEGIVVAWSESPARMLASWDGEVTCSMGCPLLFPVRPGSQNLRTLKRKVRRGAVDLVFGRLLKVSSFNSLHTTSRE